MRFEENLRFRTDGDVLWRRVSDIASIPNHWHGTKSITITGQQGGGVLARVEFAFGGSGEVRIVADQARKTLTINYLSGPFRGTQVVRVECGMLSANWDVSFNGIYRLLGRWNESHFREGTKHALERLDGRGDEEARSRES